MNRIYLVLIAGTLLLLASCATTPKDGALSGVKRVGVINLFADRPSYSKFTLINDVKGEAELPEMRNYLTQKVIATLGNSGIQGVVVKDHLPLLRGDVDLILELQPRKRDQRDPDSGIRYEDPVVDDGSNGFGFFYESVLLSKTGPEAFLAMRVVVVEDKSGELEPRSENAVFKREKINRSEIANDWRQLSDSDKQELTADLQHTIDDGVAEVIAKFGF